MRELIKLDGEFEAIDARKQVLKDGAHVLGTLRESVFSTECFTGDFCARFGRSAQRRFIKCGGFHHGIEGFGVVSLPGFITGFDLDFATLGYVEAVFVFAPKYIIGDGFKFVLCEWSPYKFGTLDIFVYEIFAFVGPVY